MKEHESDQTRAPHERLLDSLLAPDGVVATPSRGDRSLAPARDRARLAALLEEARAELSSAPEWSPVREGALVGRVLALTTGEDLSWRGELRLIAGFVRSRLSSSRALRFVAASLLLHLLALPIVALLHPGQSEPRFRISFDPAVIPGEEQRFTEDEPVQAVESLRDEAELSWREDALRRARFVLSTRRGPVLVAGGGVLEIQLLAARTRGLTHRRWGEWLNEESQVEGAGALGRILWIEVLLDRYVLVGERGPLLGSLLNRTALEAPDLPAELARMAAYVLDRARSYDLWGAPVDFDPRALPDPLARGWFEALERAVAGSALAESEDFRRWLRWGPP